MAKPITKPVEIDIKSIIQSALDNGNNLSESDLVNNTEQPKLYICKVCRTQHKLGLNARLERTKKEVDESGKETYVPDKPWVFWNICRNCGWKLLDFIDKG